MKGKNLEGEALKQPPWNLPMKGEERGMIISIMMNQGGLRLGPGLLDAGGIQLVS